MVVRNAGYEPNSRDESRRATSSDPTLVEQRIAAPHDVIVHSRTAAQAAPPSLRAGARAGSIGAAGAFSVGAAAASVPP
jgi:hypothetical protein